MQSSGSGLGGVCGIGMGIFFVCYAAANRQGVDEGCAPQYTWILTTGIVQLVSGCAGIVFTCCGCLVCCAEIVHKRANDPDDEANKVRLQIAITFFNMTQYFTNIMYFIYYYIILRGR